MAGIGPAIKTTGLTGGSSNKGATPAIKSTGKANVNKLSITGVLDEKKKAENGDAVDGDAEVAKNEKGSEAETTTAPVDAKAAAEKATQSLAKQPTIFDKMAEEAKKMQEIQDAYKSQSPPPGMGQQNQMDPNLLKALAGKGSTPKSSGSSGGSKPSQRSNSSNKEAIQKLADANKKLKENTQEQLKKMAEALKKEKAKKEKSPEDSDSAKLKKLAKELKAAKEAKKEGKADSTDTKDRKQVFSLDTVDALKDFVNSQDKLSPDQEAKLDKYAKIDDNVAEIRDKYLAKTEKQDSDSSSSQIKSSTEAESQKDLDSYDDNSFSLNDDLNTDTEANSDLDKSMDKIEDGFDKEIENSVEEAVNDDLTDEIEEDLDEDLDELLEDLEEDIDVDVE